MTLRTARITLWCTIIGLVSGGCTALDIGYAPGGGTKSYLAPGSSNAPMQQYGDATRVRTTMNVVRAHGDNQRLSSKAVRLPERPLGEIAVYTFRFPAACGGHRFRVYEAEGIEILEYEYAPAGGRADFIRDYVSGPSPFVRAGLWTAYDHTADSISGMSSQFEQRGDGMFDGVYSQGLQTGLPGGTQHDLGDAYDQALDDAAACLDVG